MFNLIETQEALKGLRLPDVMKYANGNSPEVPAYLALSELQRRKSIEDTQSAFNTPQSTVKEQIESGLTSLPPGQVNPAQAQQTVNPTTAPQLAMSPTAAPPMVNPTAAPAGVQQGAAPVMAAHGGLMMAEGGLSQLPLPHMFRQSSYADGGIVHFFEGGEGDKYETPYDRMNRLNREREAKEQSALENTQEYKDRQAQMKADQAKLKEVGSGFMQGVKSLGAAAADVISMPARGAAGALNSAVIRPLRAVTGADIPYLFGSSPEQTESMTPYYDKYIRKDEQTPSTANPTAVKPDESIEANIAGSTTKPNKVLSNPNKQASNALSGQIKPPVAPVAPAAPAAPVNSLLNPEQFRPKVDLTDTQLLERERALKKLAGVEEDPMRDIKDRYAKLEEKRAKQEADDPSERLIARLAAIGQAKATDGFLGGLGDSAIVGSKMQREQQALRDKQSSEMNALQLSMAKEDDARKRGDATAVKTERAAQEASKQALMKMGIDASNASSNNISAMAQQLKAETDRLELPIKRDQARAALIAAGKPHAPNQIDSFAALYKTHPDIAKAFLGQSKTGTMTFEEALKFVATLPKSMGLTDAQLREKATEYYQYAAGQNAPPAFKEGDKAVSNSNKPIIFKNGKWEYQ